MRPAVSIQANLPHAAQRWPRLRAMEPPAQHHDRFGWYSCDRLLHVESTLPPHAPSGPFHDPLLRARPRAHPPRRRCVTSVPQFARSRAACGGLGIQAVLAGRASQHDGDRERGDVGGDRAYRGRDEDDPGRVRRDHAAEPFAARHRRAVRHAGFALSRADRSRARAGTGHRPIYRTRPAARPRDEFGKLSAGRAGVAGAARRRAAEPGHPGRAGHGDEGAAVDPGIQHLWRAALQGCSACRSRSLHTSHRK
ncbi:hypothetical protein ACVWZV_002390 [Bradyrhizobium sp. GM5.1]